MGRNVIIPTCHPDRKHEAKGLCKECYFRQYTKRTKESRKIKARLYYERTGKEQWRVYYEANREYILKRQSNDHDKNREAINAKQRAKMPQYTHGISEEQFQSMLEAQNGLCAICHEVPAHRKNRQHMLCIDHDHTTGKIRGLLCDPCNLAIAYLKEKPELFRAAIEYLERNK